VRQVQRVRRQPARRESARELGGDDVRRGPGRDGGLDDHQRAARKALAERAHRGAEAVHRGGGHAVLHLDVEVHVHDRHVRGLVRRRIAGRAQVALALRRSERDAQRRVVRLEGKATGVEGRDPPLALGRGQVDADDVEARRPIRMPRVRDGGRHGRPHETEPLDTDDGAPRRGRLAHARDNLAGC
jgi:hypothetical protein